MCGGTAGPLNAETGMVGLSPRVRGNRDTIMDGLGASGSIPACAGEPPASRRGRAAGQVYPRVCGGTCRSCGYGMACLGLSPRVRGNPADQVLHQAGKRSIPACAGEPPTAR